MSVSIEPMCVNGHHALCVIELYRITEGSEEIQIRNVAGYLFGFIHR